MKGPSTLPIDQRLTAGPSSRSHFDPPHVGVPWGGGSSDAVPVVGGPSRDSLLGRQVPPGVLTLGTDNGSQFTARDFRRHLSARGVTHRRGGYRDPESQAFIESWFGQFKKRCAWRSEWESIDQARTEITTYIDTYHHRPHSGIGYRTPAEVAQTWRNLQTRAT